MAEAAPAQMKRPRTSNASSIKNKYYPTLTSSLSKRPMGIILEEEARKKCGKKKQIRPINKQFHNIPSKIDTGVKKVKA